jgi:hypothetical protein
MIIVWLGANYVASRYISVDVQAAVQKIILTVESAERCAVFQLRMA